MPILSTAPKTTFLGPFCEEVFRMVSIRCYLDGLSEYVCLPRPALDKLTSA